VAFVRPDVSDGPVAKIIRVKVIGEFLRGVIQLLVPSSAILFTLFMEAICSSETSALIISIQHDIPEGGNVNIK
jgi:hypothetical protein